MFKQREDNRERRTQTLQNQSLCVQKNLEVLKVINHSNDSNFEAYNYDHESWVQQQHHSMKIMQLQEIFDITENLDSVYSLQVIMDKNTQENENLSEEKMKLIRYTIKKGKQLQKRKQKNRGHKFSKEEDQRLLNCVLKKGPKFHKFFRQFPGKTPNMLKNRYYQQLKCFGSYITKVQNLNQNHHFNLISKEQVSNIDKNIDQIMLEDVEELQLFPEAEKLLSNFLGCLQSAFINIHALFLQENL